MARSSMANLITRTRRMIQDTGASPVFTDNELQDFLDSKRFVHRYLSLNGEPTYSTAGAGPTYYTFNSGDWRDWEEDVTLSNSSFATITPSTYDYLTGRFTFSTEPTYPVYLTGQTYDLYGSSAEVLRAWAARLKLEFDFESNDQVFKRSQQAAALLVLAGEYDKRRTHRAGRFYRTDIGDTPEFPDPSIYRR